MKQLIAKADVLIEALPYIQRFRDAIIVVKFGGSAMEKQANHDGILLDITFLECAGMLPVIVHGGGKAISRAMGEAGLTATFVQGLRVTDTAAIAVVERVIRGQVNAGIVRKLTEQGARARHIDGTSIFKVIKRTGTDPATGHRIDWGFVGEITDVDTAPIKSCLEDHAIPVITPLGRGADGRTYNLNADDAAAATARALKARKLAMLSDVPGLLRDRNDAHSLIPHLRIREVEKLIAKGVIDGGMLPKIRGCVDALAAGVKKIHIIDGRMSHSLLLEIFTDKGTGTEIIE